MAQDKFLDIVPNQLFEAHTISEIDQIQKKLQYEVERKREDLRYMVGERYRDLIQAADTIEEMNETTFGIVKNIKDMMSACQHIQERKLVGFQVKDMSVNQNRYQSSNSMQAVALQVKLLMEIPEKVWMSIEKEDFVQATQLFVLARHIYTGLQLHMGGSNAKGNMLSLQKLVQHQWHSISNFNEIIVDVCQQKLQDIDINIEVACSCLVSLFILDSKSMVELLDTLIGLHSNCSLKATLQFDLSSIIEGNVKEHIKEKIVNSVKVVLKTVELIFACFVDQNGGAVLAKLRDLYKKDSQPLIELVHFSDPNAAKQMPHMIATYRLSTDKELLQLDKKDITDCVQKWSAWVKSFIDQNVKALLDNINKVKVLHEIREEAFKIENPTHWPSICSSLDMPEVHMWCHYFQPLLTNRVKAIIHNRWSSILEGFKKQIVVDIEMTSSDKVAEKEVDLNWFVWKDLIGDTVIETRNDVIHVMNSLMKGMWLQDRGFTPNLDRLSRNLDEELQLLLDDLSVYLYKDVSDVKAKERLLFNMEDDVDVKQIYIDKTEIQSYLREQAEENVGIILQNIKSYLQDPNLNKTDLQKKTTAIYTARFIQSSVHLIPSLRKCFVYTESDIFNLPNNDVTNKQWTDLCAVLKENCLLCWGKWVDVVMVKVVELTSGLPQEFTMEANIDYLMVQWDVIKIEEKDDEDKSVESTIKVPSGPSLKLQEYLYAVSRVLDEIVPHTLPPEIHSMFIDKLSTISFEHYNKVIREKETDINQRCALQLLMDVRHVTLLLVPRENKKCMDFSHEICEFIRQKIDPFDYDVFYPYIQTNLKRSVQRVQTLLGSLILNHGQVTGIVGTKPITTGGTADKSPSLLTMSSTDGSQWFSLLPVTAPVNLHKKVEKVKKKPLTSSPSKSARSEISELMTSSLPINLASARSGAASFFNSMTSEWFSGS